MIEVDVLASGDCDGGFRDFVARLVEAHALPGAVFGLWRGGRCIERFAVGRLDPAGNDPMPDDALFRVYSMTKPLTAAAALMLVEQGELRLHARLGEVLPDFAHRSVTIEDLLMHTAGMIYGRAAPTDELREAYIRHGLAVNPRDLPAGALVRAVSDLPLSSSPGRRWEYGHASDLLGVIVERVTGERLSGFLARRLFAPLGMRDTGFQVDGRHAHRIAQPFAVDPIDGFVPTVPDQVFDPLETPLLDSGGAGAISTLDDYARFAGWLARAGWWPPESVPGLLSPETLAAMTGDRLVARGIDPRPGPGEAALGVPGMGYGYGVGVCLSQGAPPLAGCAGAFMWSGTAGTMFWADPHHDAVAVFMSQSPGPRRVALRRALVFHIRRMLGSG